jgi:hypothetical protein
VLPLRTHQMVVELSQPLRKDSSGVVMGSPIQSWATCPASSKSLMVRSPPGFVDETSRAASASDQRWRQTYGLPSGPEKTPPMPLPDASCAPVQVGKAGIISRM